MKSILQDEKICYVTGSPFDLHKHHIFYGTANRKNSEKNGCWCWLRADWHNMSDYGVHNNFEFNLELRRQCQAKFEETHTRQEFMNIFKRNYL